MPSSNLPGQRRGPTKAPGQTKAAPSRKAVQPKDAPWRFVGKTFGAETVDLDGAEFIECRFFGTTVRYSGGETPRIERCAFQGVHFTVDGAAARTLSMLKAMASPGSGLQQLIRETFSRLFGH